MASALTPSFTTQLRGHLSRTLCHDRVGRAIAALTGNRVRSRGCVIDTSHPAITPSTTARLFWGLYEAKEIRFIDRYVDRAHDVIDLGASIGVGSAHIARRLAPGCRLICVEANPALLDAIQTNVAHNTGGCALTVVNGAIDYSGRPTVQLGVAATNTNSRLSSAGGGVTVPALTLGQLLAQYNVRDCTVVADIEGAELGLLLHDAAALRQVRQLIIELHTFAELDQDWTPDRMRDAFVAEHGFVIRAAHGPVYVFER